MVARIALADFLFRAVAEALGCMVEFFIERFLMAFKQRVPDAGGFKLFYYVKVPCVGPGIVAGVVGVGPVV